MLLPDDTEDGTLAPSAPTLVAQRRFPLPTSAVWLGGPTSDHLSLWQLMDNSYGVPSRRCRRNRKEQDLNRLLTKANKVTKVFGLDIAVSVPFK